MQGLPAGVCDILSVCEVRSICAVCVEQQCSSTQAAGTAAGYRLLVLVPAMRSLYNSYTPLLYMACTTCIRMFARQEFIEYAASCCFLQARTPHCCKPLVCADCGQLCCYCCCWPGLCGLRTSQTTHSCAACLGTFSPRRVSRWMRWFAPGDEQQSTSGAALCN